jgi:hypothetical protein
MPYPSDILLPSNAKYYAFVDEKLEYNPHWDINWSFQYAMQGTQGGFCTFLTHFTPTTGWAGHYLGYSGNAVLSSYLTTESGDYIFTENGERMLVESETGIGTNGILAIGFDSTGLFALSSATRGGVGLGSIRQNTLVIRDAYDNVIVNAELSALNPNFTLLSSNGDIYQTLRFRYSQAGNKLSIDFKRTEDTKYNLLTSITTRLVIPEYYPNVNVGFSYCSPISSASITPSTLKIRNFHTQGNSYLENYEYTTFTPITAVRSTSYSTLSSVFVYDGEVLTFNGEVIIFS